MKRIFSIAMILVVLVATMLSAVQRFHCNEVVQEQVATSCCSSDHDTHQNEDGTDCSEKNCHHDCHSSHRPIVWILDKMIYMQAERHFRAQVSIESENQRVPKGPYLDLEKPPII